MFNPHYKQLVFELEENEFDLQELYVELLPQVIRALKTYTSYTQMVENFPDIHCGS